MCLFNRMKLIIFLLLLSEMVAGQRSIKGYIKNVKGSPLPYASIRLRADSTNYYLGFAISDGNGFFKLNINNVRKIPFRCTSSEPTKRRNAIALCVLLLFYFLFATSA